MDGHLTSPQPKPFNVLLLGDGCYDVYRYGTVERISPEAPVPIFSLKTGLTLKGMAFNVEANLKELGVKVTTITGGSLSEKTRLIDTIHGVQVLRIDDDKISEPIPIPVELNRYDAIIISDYCKGSINRDVVHHVRQEYTGPIFADTKNPDLKVFNGCFVKVNASEYARRNSDCTDIIVTRGGDGAEYNGTTYTTHKVDVADVCGAGDTFLAALTYGYLKFANIHQAIMLANKAASITVQHHGVYAPSLNELQLSC